MWPNLTFQTFPDPWGKQTCKLIGYWLVHIRGLSRREVGSRCWGDFLEEVMLSLRLVGKPSRKEFGRDVEGIEKL